MARSKQEFRRSRRRLEVRYGADAPRFIGYSRNLSRTGIMLGALRVFAPGTVLHLEMTLKDGPVRALGTVVWARSGSLQWLATGRVGMGIRFVDPPPNLLSLLPT